MQETRHEEGLTPRRQCLDRGAAGGGWPVRRAVTRRAGHLDRAGVQSPGVPWKPPQRVQLPSGPLFMLPARLAGVPLTHTVHGYRKVSAPRCSVVLTGEALGGRHGS